MPAPAAPNDHEVDDEADETAGLRQRYQTLVNDTLPATYTQPIRFNHCFGRVVLDWLFGDVWYGHVERPAYRNLTADQLRGCIGRMERWLADHDTLVSDNAASLRLRGKQPSGERRA